MKISICGSMAFAKEMMEAKEFLEKQGHVCFVPEGITKYASGEIKVSWQEEGAQRKINHNLIRAHHQKIQESDAILVMNHSKNGVEYYIGGNTFLEMGFAHVLNKPIFLLNPLPEMNFIKEELLAMQPVILNGDLTKIAPS